MDFFEAQELARRTSRRLVAWTLLAYAATIACYSLAAAAVSSVLTLYWTGEARVPWQVPAAAAALVGGVALVVSAWRWWQLREGGAAVARLLGARPVDPERCTGAERRCLNCVEEMAIASGVAVPPVYVVGQERAVNALVAGYSPNEAVIVVTRGALELLSRDELQGVIGHEFSHLLNGDMALNLRLAALLAGLTWIGEQGEALVFRGDPLGAWFGLAIAFIGFPGTLAASAIRAAVSRSREFLADAASVQFTRNPEGIAGALDSILALPAHTTLAAAQAEELAHMFFAPAVGHWYTFPTHPPIGARIWRAHPRFQRDDYRERRHGRRQQVAVIDGAGEVVKHVRAGDIVATVGRPGAQHLDFGRRLLERLPTRLREALHRPQEAEQVLYALGGFGAPADLQALVDSLGREHMLTLAELAVPALKGEPQATRDRFIAEFAARVEADRRVTRRELVLLTFLRQHLREGAGKPIPTRYRTVAEVSEDARTIVSLLAAAGGVAALGAFAKGAEVLKLGWDGPTPVQAMTAGRVFEALERLRHLAPFAKPALLKACVETAMADGEVTLAEADLVRAVAATLDCPLPPIIDSGSLL